ncbi:hypothetical protein JW905_10380, partial [bacterium]|nr:hypothetical protein [candidate division CSSED10-310 bacterium]
MNARVLIGMLVRWSRALAMLHQYGFVHGHITSDSLVVNGGEGGIPVASLWLGTGARRIMGDTRKAATGDDWRCLGEALRRRLRGAAGEIQDFPSSGVGRALRRFLNRLLRGAVPAGSVRGLDRCLRETVPEDVLNDCERERVEIALRRGALGIADQLQHWLDDHSRRWLEAEGDIWWLELPEDSHCHMVVTWCSLNLAGDGDGDTGDLGIITCGGEAEQAEVCPPATTTVIHGLRIENAPTNRLTVILERLRERGLPVIVIGSMASGFALLSGPVSARRFSPGPLSESAVKADVIKLFPDLSGASLVAGMIYRETLGDPILTGRYLQHLIHEGVLSPDRGVFRHVRVNRLLP